MHMRRPEAQPQPAGQTPPDPIPNHQPSVNDEMTSSVLRCLAPRNLLLAGLAAVLAACGTSDFKVDYPQVPAEQSRNWRVADVRVTVPDTLVVSEEDTLIPKADIVWHGDAAGDRKAQVADIVRQGVLAGSNGLRGSKRVTMDVSLLRFHALTPRAYRVSPSWAGVNNVIYEVTVRDAAGAVVLGPERIEADMAAVVAKGNPSNEAQRVAGGQTRRSLVAHVAHVTRAWLGLGPDIRTKVSRVGG